MKILNSFEIELSIVEKNGKFFAFVWEIPSMDLLLDKQCNSVLEARSELSQFVFNLMAVNPG